MVRVHPGLHGDFGGKISFMKKSRKKISADKILEIGTSPLDRDEYWFDEEYDDELEVGIGEIGDSLVVSGEMEVGSSGNPVSIKITDEVTGMEMELSHVKNALLVVEDKRSSSSGWLSMLVGDVNKVGDVLRFIAKATVEELSKLTKKGR